MEHEVLFKNLKNNINEGYALLKIIPEKENSVSFRFMDVNDKFEEYFSLENNGIEGISDDIAEQINAAILKWFNENKDKTKEKDVIEKVKLNGKIFNIKIMLFNEEYLMTLFDKVNGSLSNEELSDDSYANFKILFESSPLGIYIADIDGNILDGNKKLIDLLGSPSLEATKKINVLHYPPLVKNGYADSFRMCLKTGKTQKIEIMYVSKWGRHLFLSSYIVPLKDNEGNVIRVYTLMEDITKRKQIEKDLQTEKQRLANIIEGTQAGSWQWNIQTGELILNEKWFEMLGYKSTDFSTHTFDTWAGLTHPDDKKKSERKLNEHFEGKTDHYENELRMRHKNGEWIWIKDSGKLITRTEEGEPLWMFGTHLNINDRKKYEERINHRLHYEESISKCSAALLSRQKNAIQYSLNKLLNVSGTSRIYIFENFIDDDNMLSMRQTYEVCADHASPQIDNPELQHIVYQKDGFQRWEKLLKQGDILSGNISDFPESEQEILKSQDIKTILIIPLYINHKWFGFIGFDDTLQERNWTDEDIYLLKVFSEMLSNYFERKENENKLIESKKELSEAQKMAKLGAWELNLNDRMITLSEEHQFMIVGKLQEVTMPLSEYAAKYIVEQDIPIIQEKYENACDNIGNDNYEDEFEYRTKTNIPGEQKYLLVNSKFREKAVVSGVTQDITERKKAENLLKEREEQFRTIFDNSPQPMALTEVSSGRIVEVNNIFCKKTELSKDFLLGKTTVEHGFYSEDDRDMFKAELLSNGYVDGLEMTFNVTEDIMFICKMYATFITVNAQKFILTTFYDITDQKRAEDQVLKQKEQFELAVNGTNDGIWDWNIKTNDLYLSRRWKEILGFHDHELENNFETFSGNIHPDDKPRVFDFVNEYLAGKIENYEIEFRMKHKDGSYRWILAKGEALRDENNIPYRMAGSHSDITERKEMERRIIKEKEKAEHANRAKSEFLANMSHEIRTPMNSILGFSEVMLNTTTDAKNISYLKTILSSGKTLLTLINDILDLSKIEAGRMQISPEPVSVRCVINEMKEIFKQKTDEKNLDFIVRFDDDFPENITLDEVRLRQILLNLIGNAVKFTSDGYVKTDVKLLNEKDGIIDFEIAVIDTGIGIAEKDKKQIFDSFSQQSGQDAKRYGGTGLGLAITKRLCELMNGRIEVESTLGKGSKFVVSFRNIKYSDQKIDREDEDLWNEENLVFFGASVMIVDDVPHNKDLIVSYLQNYDLKLYTADNGKMAVDFALDLTPDLILMDIRMPGLNGYEATEIIKSNKKTKHIPIVALTASTMQREDEEIKDLFEGYLRKPVRKRSLIHELTRFIPYKEIETDKDKEESKEDSEKVSPDIISEELKTEFREKFFEKMDNLTKTMIVNNINSFADEVISFAEVYDLDYLKLITNDLKKNLAEFDFVKMKKTLEKIRLLFN